MDKPGAQEAADVEDGIEEKEVMKVLRKPKEWATV
jgi:hypothetical protein